MDDDATVFGDFLIVVRAEQQDAQWVGFYRINKFADDGTRSQVFEDEEELELRFPSKEEAKAAAREFAEKEITRGSDPKWTN